MDAARYERLCRLFDESWGLPPEQREVFVARETAGDSELEAALRAALGEASAPTSFLERPVPELIAGRSAAQPGVIGRYRIVRFLGSGGMGRVFLAEQQQPRRLVALKITHESELSAEGAARFSREAELLGRLDHPGIARVIEAGREETPEGAFAFIAMELVAGEPLADRLAAGGSDADVVAVVEKVARALHAAHEAGVVHRDVKPHNIIIRPDGEPVLVDFGIARDQLEPECALTRTGSQLGTPAYMAPEQIERGPLVDHRADLWSLGVILYEGISGRRPFDAPTREGLFDAILRRSPAPVALDGARRRRDLRKVLAVALDKEPDRRYASAAALADDLARLGRGEPVAVSAPGPIARLAAWSRRNAGLAWMAGTALLLGLIAAVALGFLAARWGDLRAGRQAEEGRRLERLLEVAWLEFSDGGRVDAIHRLEAADVGAERRGEIEPSLAAMRALVSGREPGSEWPTGGDPSFLEYVRGVHAMRRAWDGDTSAFGEARRHFENAIIVSPRPRALYLIGRLHALARSAAPDEIRAHAELITARFPDSLAARAAAAGALERSAPRDAARLYREALRRWPREPALLSGLSAALLRAGEHAEATRVARELLARQPDLVAARINLANLLVLAGENEEALPLARAAAAADPCDARARQVLGEAAYGSGDLELSLESYTAAAKLAPRNVPVLRSLGRLLQGRGRVREAVDAFRRACDAAPSNASVHAEHAAALVQAGRLEEAAAAAERSVALDARQLMACVNLASVRWMLGSPHSAIRQARAAIGIKETCGEAWIVLGQALSELGRLEEALVAFERADEIGRASPAWPHPTADFVASTRQLIAAAAPAPAWLAAASRAGAAAAEGRDEAAAAAMQELARVMEDDLERDRASDSSLTRRLRILADDPALDPLRDAEALDDLDPELQVRIRGAWRALREIEDEVAGGS